MSATASATIASVGRADEEKSRATGSAAEDESHADWKSELSAEDWLANETQLPENLAVSRRGTRVMPQDMTSREDVRSLVKRLEALQAHSSLKSPQQPATSKRYLQQRKTGSAQSTLDQHPHISEMDALLDKALRENPEQRARMAIMTRSGWLRKKILSYKTQAHRSAGCGTLGGSQHAWRMRETQHYTDHNWPRVNVDLYNPHLPASHLPGGDERHDRLLRCPVDKLPLHPTQDQQPFYSISREKRWWGCKENGELDKHFQQKRAPPGPGAFHKTAPRGPHFHADEGETVVMGANHPFPWKSPMGDHINPSGVHASSEHHSAPKYSFSKTRRSCSDTFLGHGQQAGGPVKSDEGCLSPGHVYELYSTFTAGPGLKGKRRTRASTCIPRMRMHPVPPDPEVGAGSQGDQDEFGATVPVF